MNTTYRLVDLENPANVGKTAATPELAKLVQGDLARNDQIRLCMVQTDWHEEFGKRKITRSIVIEAESHAGEWKLGLQN